MKVGVTIAGRYELRESLGGGRAALFLAHDRHADRSVAVRVFDPAHVAPADLQRYTARIAAAAAVDHPAVVVPRVQIGTSESPPFVAGEVLQGQDLAGLCAHTKPLPWPRALAIAHACAEGLAALAALTGAAHCGLRPGNVWIGADGRVRILDFGIAELGAPPTRPRQDGTFVEYRAPEQLQGSAGDARSDVFSIGVLLFEMITGVHPFSGQTAAEVAIKMLMQSAPAATQIAPQLEIPPPLVALLARALARRPRDRFADTAALAHELEALLAVQSIVAGTPTASMIDAPPSAAPVAPSRDRLEAGDVRASPSRPTQERPTQLPMPALADDTLDLPARPLVQEHAGILGEKTEVLGRLMRPLAEKTEVLGRPSAASEKTEVLGRGPIQPVAQKTEVLSRPANRPEAEKTEILGRPPIQPVGEMTEVLSHAGRRTGARSQFVGTDPAHQKTEVFVRRPIRPPLEQTEVLPRHTTGAGQETLDLSAAAVARGEHPAPSEAPVRVRARTPAKSPPIPPDFPATSSSPTGSMTPWSARTLIAVNIALAILMVAVIVCNLSA